jgi:DNA-binding response OmpR family regulator
MDDRRVVLVVWGTSTRGDGGRFELGPGHHPAEAPQGAQLGRRAWTVADDEVPRRAVLRRADVELDPLRHTAHRAGRPLALSAREFAVLEALMATRAVLSAEDLLAQAWDEHADPFTHTVKVTISRLRKKLGGPPLIENIVRVGYRLADGPAP